VLGEVDLLAKYLVLYTSRGRGRTNRPHRVFLVLSYLTYLTLPYGYIASTFTFFSLWHFPVSSSPNPSASQVSQTSHLVLHTFFCRLHTPSFTRPDCRAFALFFFTALVQSHLNHSLFACLPACFGACIHSNINHTFARGKPRNIGPRVPTSRPNKHASTSTTAPDKRDFFLFQTPLLSSRGSRPCPLAPFEPDYTQKITAAKCPCPPTAASRLSRTRRPSWPRPAQRPRPQLQTQPACTPTSPSTTLSPSPTMPSTPRPLFPRRPPAADAPPCPFLYTISRN
jgi:hypothetical protein